ncbi:unnamed protein product [Owenia fusiformis]|uniref:Uncharacterized protein n=1 Tax=Owenia fusiformis TaxID=6347 RepID=A0A8J1XWX4_OWEFU|nr:unnamed protein product [Owenia fusiformis]
MPMRRTIKNVVNNYSDAQVKVREATSNDPWGPSSTLMSEIADLTYNVVAFTEIMQMIWKRLNDHGKNWRHVYKSLMLLEYIIKTGSEKVAQQCKENIFAVQTLKDFQYVEENKDQGINVREKAKMLVNLLKDDERLRNERTKALKAKERFAQTSVGIGSTTPPGDRLRHDRSGSPAKHSGGYTDTYGTPPRSESAHSALSHEIESARPSTTGEEELQLQLALAMSKEEHDEEVKKKRQDDVKLQMAIEESARSKDDEWVPGAGARPQQAPSGVLDVIGATTQASSSDPWGSPLAPPPGSHKHQQPAPPPQAAAQSPKASADPWGDASGDTLADPWAAPAPTAAPVDPFSSPVIPPLDSRQAAPVDPFATPGAQPPSTNSPWEAPASVPTASSKNTAFGDPFAPAPAAQNGNGSIDDAFDLLSVRSSTEVANVTSTSSTSSPLMTGMQHNNLGGIDGQKMSKSPEGFLGPNANLVNLDNLVSKPAPAPASTMNPFDMMNPQPAHQSNPFQVAAQQQRVPLNQLQSQQNVGFTQQQSILPTPLLPMSQQQTVPMMQEPASNNPFL